jgi:hypothetical protein
MKMGCHVAATCHADKRSSMCDWHPLTAQLAAKVVVVVVLRVHAHGATGATDTSPAGHDLDLGVFRRR